MGLCEKLVQGYMGKPCASECWPIVRQERYQLMVSGVSCTLKLCITLKTNSAACWLSLLLWPHLTTYVALQTAAQAKSSRADTTKAAKAYLHTVYPNKAVITD